MGKVIGWVVLSAMLLACSETSNISDVGQNGHTIKDYKQARQLFWRHLYPVDGSTLYCGQKFQTDQRQGINIEHVFPMSWVANALKCGKRKQCRNKSELFNRIEGDLHNLYPSRSDVNQDRSSFRFGEVKGEPRKYGKQCDFEVSPRARIVEPAPAIRGDIARSMFYMSTTYKQAGLVIFKKQAKMLLDWHKTDPPNANEKRRNNVIEKIQGARNPYIDQPELLEAMAKRGELY